MAFVGRALKGVRAGETKLSWSSAGLGSPELMTLTSSAFPAGGPMPERYAGRGVGENISPPLAWTGVPPGAAELALIVQDPDVPMARPFAHCIAHALPPDLDGLAEGALSAAGADPRIKIARRYIGPRPLRGHGPHRYVFQLFALDAPAGLPVRVSSRRLVAAISGHVMARGRLDGWFELA
jgi:hypothetical protein